MNSGGTNLKLQKYCSKIPTLKKNSQPKSYKNLDKGACSNSNGMVKGQKKESPQNLKMSQRKLSAPMLLSDNNYAGNNQILSNNLNNMNMYEQDSSTTSQVDYGV